MAKINNTDLMNEMRDVAKIQVGSDFIPNVLSNQVVPVIDVNPKHARNAKVLGSLSRTTTGAASIATIPSGKQTFITGIFASYIKDVACDSATGDINIAITNEEGTSYLVRFPIITLTAQSDSIFISLEKPIKVNEGTTPQFSGTFTVGVLLRTAILFGYSIDNSNA